jgi:hypothetical protein
VHENIVITYVPSPFTRKEKYSSKKTTIHGQKGALHISSILPFVMLCFCSSYFFYNDVSIIVEE